MKPELRIKILASNEAANKLNLNGFVLQGQNYEGTKVGVLCPNGKIEMYDNYVHASKNLFDKYGFTTPENPAEYIRKEKEW